MNHDNQKSEQSRIVRILRERNRNYVTIHNAIALDRRASLKARGLFFTLMTLPPNWDFSVRGLVSILKESKNAVYSALDELVELGYATKRPLPRRNGKFNRIVLILRENVQDEWPETLEDQTVSHKSDTVDSDTVSGAQLSKQQSTSQKKKRAQIDRGFAPVADAGFLNLQNEFDDATDSPLEPEDYSQSNSVASILTPIPDEFTATPEMLEWAESHGLSNDIEFRTGQFIRFQRRRGNTSDDWEAEWRVWMQHPYEPRSKIKESKATAQTKDVFAFYQDCHNKNAKLDQKRIDVINAALKLYNAIELKKAIFGALGDEWVTGGSEGSTRKHNDISYILKDSDKIDAFIVVCEAHANEEGYQIYERRPDYSLWTWTWGLDEKLKNHRKPQHL